MLGAAGITLLAWPLAILIGLSVSVTALCSSQPPPMPHLSSTWSDNSPADYLQAFQSAAWPYYCQCVPGTPPPINFPPPSFTPPADWPAAPTFPCNPADLCGSLSRIETLLNQLSTTLGQDYNLTTLIQRYHVPFALIPGAMHNGISGEGSVSVPRLIGVQYDVVTQPANVVTLPGVRPYIKDLGWIGFEIAAGGLIEHRVTRDHEIWTPPQAQMSNLFGWSLTPGTTINVRELYAEP